MLRALFVIKLSGLLGNIVFPLRSKGALFCPVCHYLQYSKIYEFFWNYSVLQKQFFTAIQLYLWLIFIASGSILITRNVFTILCILSFPPSDRKKCFHCAYTPKCQSLVWTKSLNFAYSKMNPWFDNPSVILSCPLPCPVGPLSFIRVLWPSP